LVEIILGTNIEMKIKEQCAKELENITRDFILNPLIVSLALN
jgi:hypothetical protein